MDKAVMRERLREKKRIVVKVGSASITHERTGGLNLGRIERLVRVLSDLKEEGRDVILVSSGAIACGRHAMKVQTRPRDMAEKQAFAAIGQARLMMTYQKLFAEYSQTAAQLLLTKNIMLEEDSRQNVSNTFSELLKLGAIPVVNENDTVSTSEIHHVETFGDNDQLAAIVAAITHADLLILLSDIDGLFTDDPRENPEAEFIDFIPVITERVLSMGKGSGSMVGTGGMSSKLAAARIATDSGSDMLIARFTEADVISRILCGENIGTLFAAHPNVDFDLLSYIKTM
ncbi:glutamate 5-kinase [Oribacterium sp. oral taxon 102]|uniref:glutamate 5-kinase n=1 Tax=Oribacterium sp. oral taxon 102 TaxID=671214 RepID=UPI001FAE3894|nr:glutamate 5-kinase [Oribacterium sp. oral taxon 102]